MTIQAHLKHFLKKVETELYIFGQTNLRYFVFDREVTAQSCVIGATLAGLIISLNLAAKSVPCHHFRSMK